MTTWGSGQQLRLGHYSRKQMILCVGEGSFAFSSALAISFGSAPNLYATSADSYEIFCERYGAEGISRVVHLMALGAKVCFGVDITTLVSNPWYPDALHLLSKRFHRVVFNYPHAGYPRDLQLFSTPFSVFQRRHEDLVRNFFHNVSRALLAKFGEIHITHKTTVHKRWKFNRSARLCGLSLKGHYIFVPESFPGYRPCRGAGSNWLTTFPLGKGSKTYIYAMD